MSSVTLLEQENKQQKAEISRLTARVEELSEQIKWFQNQLFGQKSDRRIIEQNKDQLFLGEQFKPE